MHCNSYNKLILDNSLILPIEVNLHRAGNINQLTPYRSFEYAACGWLGGDLVFGVAGSDSFEFAFDLF